MNNKLQYFNEKYQEILNSNGSLTKTEKNKRLSDLMTEMEMIYKIPILKSPMWENKNRDIIDLYKKISLSRTL